MRVYSQLHDRFVKKIKSWRVGETREIDYKVSWRKLKEPRVPQVEEEIQTLRHVLANKIRVSQELKRKLGISVWKEITDDMNQGLKNVKESQVYVLLLDPFEARSALRSSTLSPSHLARTWVVSELGLRRCCHTRMVVSSTITRPLLIDI